MKYTYLVDNDYLKLRSPNFASSSNMAPILAKTMVTERTRWIKYNHVKMNGTDKTLGGVWPEEKQKK